MKRFIWRFLVLMVAGGLLMSCNGTKKTPEPSPEDGAQEWIDAITNLDGNRILKYTCLAQREKVKEGSMWTSAFMILGQMFTTRAVQIEGDVSDLKFETLSQSEKKAEVRVYGELRIAVLGSAEAYPVDERWQMIRENDTWRWCGSSTSASPIAQVTSSSNQPSSPSSTFTVYANQDWQDTGYSIGPETLIKIEYVSEQWSPWAGGFYDGQGFPGGDPYANNIVPGIHAGLIARIGDNQPFFVGNKFVAITTPPHPALSFSELMILL